MRRWRYLLVLMVAAPLCAEIFNRSTSLSQLTSWPAVATRLLPYSLLIVILVFLAEQAPQPSSQLLLLPIAGMVIEGLITRSFFNPSFHNLSVLSGVGSLWGVQWPWTLSLIASHAMVSFLLPLTIASVLKPKEVCVGKGLATAAALVLGVYVIGITLIVPGALAGYATRLAATLLAMGLLVLLFFTVRPPQSARPNVPSWAFFLAGLAFAPLNWLSSFFLARGPLVVLVLAQGAFLAAYLYFVWSQWLTAATADSSKLLFVAGYLIPAAVVPALLGWRSLPHDPVGLATIGVIVALVAVAARQPRSCARA